MSVRVIQQQVQVVAQRNAVHASELSATMRLCASTGREVQARSDFLVSRWISPVLVSKPDNLPGDFGFDVDQQLVQQTRAHLASVMKICHPIAALLQTCLT